MKKFTFLLTLIALASVLLGQQGVYKYGVPTINAAGDTLEERRIRDFIKTDTAIYCTLYDFIGFATWTDQDFIYHSISNYNPDETKVESPFFCNQNQVFLKGAKCIYKFSNNAFDSISYPFVVNYASQYKNTFVDEGCVYIATDTSLYVYSDSSWTQYPFPGTNFDFMYNYISFAGQSGLDCYLGTTSGLYHFSNGNIFLSDSMIVRVYGIDPEQRLWVVHREKGTGNIKNGTFTSFASFYTNTDLQDFSLTSPSYIYFGSNGINYFQSFNNSFVVPINDELWYLYGIFGTFSVNAFPDLNEVWFRGPSKDTITYVHIDEVDLWGKGIDGRYQYKDFKILDVNNMSAPYHTWGNLFSIYPQVPVLRWPKDSANYAMTTSLGLLIGGFDNNEQLHLSTLRHRTYGCDFYPGPLDTVTAMIDTATVFQYDRIWSVSRNEIELFNQMFDAGTLTGSWYHIPKDILEWPASGTGNISRNLAPFVDHNGDGQYNPHDGDYPEVKGDELLWWVYNDNFAPNTVTDARTLGVEIQASAWAFNHDNSVDSLKILNNCNFIHYDVINRSDSIYYDTYLGIYDYGNLAADNGYNGYYLYSGCDVDNSSMYHYNFEPDDTISHPWQMAEWVSFLDGPLAEENDGIDNDHDFDIDEPGETITMSSFVPTHCCPPISPSCQQFTKDHYSNYLHGKRYNGEPFYYFDDFNWGGDTSSQVITKYVFPDDSNPNGWGQNGNVLPPWNESSSWGMGSRVNFGSVGLFTFYPGQKVSLDIVIGASWSDTTNLSASSFHTDIEHIRTWFAEGSIPVGIVEPSTEAIENNIGGIRVFPNPVSGDFINLDFENPIRDKVQYSIYDTQGRLISSAKLSGKSRIRIPLADIGKGVYLIKLTGDSTNEQASFIKM
ncbi:MAG: T9SS type A sorting domain-containing protein [Bacteroidales bacterium]|nr:T9SS type A sorting domain-containing protein [Bacteroidales bacterium]MCF8456011.1 T9SS type A sorting domain-containing protein [Bacteroidales bacterium]